MTTQAAQARAYFTAMCDLTFPGYPFRHVRPSLIFEVEKWAVVCVSTEEYYREWAMEGGDQCASVTTVHDGVQCGCDFEFHNGIQWINHVGCNFLQHVTSGSQIEVLGVCDGVGCDGQPCASPSFATGFIWARHFFETGWIPVRYLLPLNLSLEENEVQRRILRAWQVPGHVRREFLPFSPRFDSSYVQISNALLSIRSESISPLHRTVTSHRFASLHRTVTSISEEVWDTDSIGNFQG